MVLESYEPESVVTCEEVQISFKIKIEKPMVICEEVQNQFQN